MLLKTIYRYYENTPSKGTIPLPKYDDYIIMLSNRKIQLTDRLNKGYITEIDGARLIKHILGLIEHGILRNYISDLDKLLNYFIPNKDLFDGIFDTVRTNKKYHALFCSPSNIFNPDEFILPISKFNYINELPLDKPWSYWTNEKPVRIISHDSNEYTLDIVNGIKFNIDPPYFITIGIDTIVLTFMYHKYIEANPDEEFPLQTFIYRYVTIPLLNDLQDIWLRNQISHIVDVVSSGEYDRLDELYDSVKIFSDYNYIGSNYRSVLKEITEPIKKLQRGNFNVRSILDSMYLSNPTISLFQNIQILHNECRLPELRQYEVSSYLKNMDTVKLLLKLFMLNRNSSETKNLLIRINRDIDRFHRNKFWQNSKENIIRDLIKEDIEEMKETIS